MRKKLCVLYHNEHCYTKNMAENIKIGSEDKGVESFMWDVNYAAKNLDVLDDMDAIVFGSPTHFGSVSAEMKLLMDSTVDIWNKKKWRNKIAAGFTHSSAMNGDKLSVLMQIFIFSQQHGMIWTGLDLKSCEVVDEYGDEPLNIMGSWSGLMDISPSKNIQNKVNDNKTARYFGARLATVTNNFNQV
ncbi:MAG: NAD(P)H dehydrogenase (quinone) [Candidatus Midichloriaceae bacterium]|jgi:NAD(P)H dehydrogenase (quinone)